MSIVIENIFADFYECVIVSIRFYSANQGECMSTFFAALQRNRQHVLSVMAVGLFCALFPINEKRW
ncbi:hypothetical protein A2791_03450 [Candidatus Saccharibacteria bacterium RIFCSPHIGHO2_01_FULL_46_30]|nr:MAG: hypothetical protein A2791_03450 [Candidatus Saccharibacteria bacterium RIFCSPHIGHO2_01_FULL_46_30]